MRAAAMIPLRRALVLSSLAAGFWLAVSAADAAPQILGLVASNGLPTPLACSQGYCSAFLASFCLQESRDAPNTGSDYELASGGGLTLVETLADGRQLRQPAEKLVSLRSYSGFTNISVSLPASTLATAVRSVALEIASGTTILPAPLAGDPTPQSAEEIARAVGPLRHLAAETFDRSGETADAARLVALVINGMPAERSAPAVALDSLWPEVASSAQDKVAPDGLAKAAGIVEGCRKQPGAVTNYAIGFCLASREAELLTSLNRRFWDAAGGS
jgi:hypothetical protein